MKTHSTLLRFSEWTQGFLGLLVAVAVVAAGGLTAKAQTLPAPSKKSSYSALAKLGPDIYLVAHDMKAKQGRQEKALTIITIMGGVVNGYYPISGIAWPTTPNWAAKPSESNDLESLCVVPDTLITAGTQNTIEVLAAESGYVADDAAAPTKWLGGRIFHMKVEFDTANLSATTASVKHPYDLPSVYGINLFGDIERDNFEGMACAKSSAGKLLVLLGERGGAKKNGPQRLVTITRGQLMWSTIDLAAQTIGDWTPVKDGSGNSVVYAPVVGWVDAIRKRDVSALFICGNEVWAAATEEQSSRDENEPPFRSAIYQVATFNKNAGPYFHLVDKSKVSWPSAHKIEGIAGGAPGTTGSCNMATVSDDENWGGTYWELP